MLKSQQVYLEIGEICSDCFVSTSIAKDALAKALSQTYNAIMQFHQNGAGGKSVTGYAKVLRWEITRSIGRPNGWVRERLWLQVWTGV